MITIVSAYIRDGVIRDFLEMLDGTDCQVVIVNNGSENIEHTAIDELVTHEQRVPYSKSFNSGLKKAEGEYVIQISNDVFPEDNDWVEKMVESCKERRLVHPLIRDDERHYLHHKNFGKGVKKYTGLSLPSHCWILRRKDLILYDEGYKGFNGEDDDYCIRFRQRGGELYINNNLIVEHRHHLRDTKNENVDRKSNIKRLKEKWQI